MKIVFNSREKIGEETRRKKDDELRKNQEKFIFSALFLVPDTLFLTPSLGKREKKAPQSHIFSA